MKLLLDIIIYIFSALGGVVSIITIYKWISPYKKISWGQVEKGVLALKEKLIMDNYVPTLIVGIGRGGAITGALLSGCLGHVPVLVIERVYDWSGDYRKEQLFEDIKLKKILRKFYLLLANCTLEEPPKHTKSILKILGQMKLGF